MNTIPLYELIIKTPRLILRLPNEFEINQLALLAGNGIQEKGEEYFDADWLHVPYPENKKLFSDWVLKDLEYWDIDSWKVPFAAFFEGKPIGMQHIFSKNFVIARGIGTGVWLGKEYQGKGFGTEVGEAILYFAFTSLGAQEAYAGAWMKNKASLRVLEKLGYIYNGQYTEALNDKPEVNIRMRLPREVWKTHKEDSISVKGMKACLPLFGLE